MPVSSQLSVADWLTFVASFALVLGIIGALFYLLRHLGTVGLGGRSDRQINVLETHIVGNRQRIILLRAKDREVLIGMTVNQITTLATWPADDTPLKKTAFGSADTPPPSVKSVTSVTSVTNGAGLRQLLSKLQGRK